MPAERSHRPEQHEPPDSAEESGVRRLPETIPPPAKTELEEVDASAGEIESRLQRHRLSPEERAHLMSRHRKLQRYRTKVLAEMDAMFTDHSVERIQRDLEGIVGEPVEPKAPKSGTRAKKERAKKSPNLPPPSNESLRQANALTAHLRRNPNSPTERFEGTEAEAARDIARMEELMDQMEELFDEASLLASFKNGSADDAGLKVSIAERREKAERLNAEFNELHDLYFTSAE